MKNKLLTGPLSAAHRLLNVLEVVAPFKHFNKLREFVQMKLPPGFPVKLGECAWDPLLRSPVWVSLKRTNLTLFAPSLRRHPRLPHDHRHRHLSGISLRRIWRVHFLHPFSVQRRSQSLPRPLTSKHPHTGSDQRVEYVRKKGNTNAESCIVWAALTDHLLLSATIHCCGRIQSKSMQAEVASHMWLYCVTAAVLAFPYTRCSPTEQRHLLLSAAAVVELSPDSSIVIILIFSTSCFIFLGRTDLFSWHKPSVNNTPLKS